MEESMFHRARLLLGAERMERVGQTNVIIFGVGGVGSWCAEALVRTGVGRLTIVDSDTVCPSNINRQLMATTATVGQAKVDALSRRLKEINPEARITALKKVFSEETAAEFELEKYDFIVDCIDSLKDKAYLIWLATRQPGCFISSMGAARKSDPTGVEVTEFWKVRGCPLARALRQRFKKSKMFPAKKFKCVYSEEVLRNQEEADVNGSLMHVTAIFGLTIAGLIINAVRT